MNDVLYPLLNTPAGKFILFGLTAITTGCFGLAIYFLIDFKKNIEKTLDEHSNKLGRQRSELNEDIKELRFTMTKHSEDMLKTNSQITISLYKMKEDGVEFKKQLRDEMNSILKSFLLMKTDLEKIELRMKSSAEDMDKNYGKIIVLQNGLRANIIELKELKKKMNETDAVSQENREALLKEKEILKVYGNEIREIKKKMKA